MTPPRSPVPRARSPLHWLAGVLLVGVLLGGLAAAAITLWENVDLRQLTGRSAPPPPPPPAAVEPAPAARPAGAGFEAALYASPASAGFFPDSSFYPDLLDRWARLIREAGGNVRRVTGAAAVADLGPATLLVVPAGLCLSGTEVSALESHVAAGGALLATWATGARDGGCQWRGWAPVSSLAGSPDVRQLQPRKALYLTLPAGTPLLGGLSPATRIEVRSAAQLAVALSGPHAYWSDWALNPAPAESGGEADGALVARTTGSGGRVVWLGFLASQAAAPRDSALLERVEEAGLRWAAGIPTASLAPWPSGHDAALLVAEEAETGFENAGALARLLAARKTPGSFYVVSSLALDHPDLADTLLAAGEVGAQTSDHRSIAGLPEADQRVRLGRTLAEVRGWTGRRPEGFRPPEERFDTTTLRVWRALGGRYVLAVNDARVGSPERFFTPHGPVVVLPRIIDSDYNVMVQRGEASADALLSAYLGGARKLGLLGGLAVLSLHTQVAGTPARVGVVGSVLDSLAAGPVSWWAATGDEIARWWLARSETTIALSRRSGDTLEVRVTAPPGDSLPAAWVEVWPGRRSASAAGKAAVRRRSEGSGTGTASWTVSEDGRPVSYRPTRYGIDVPVGALGPGESRTVRITPGGAG